MVCNLIQMQWRFLNSILQHTQARITNNEFHSIHIIATDLLKEGTLLTLSFFVFWKQQKPYDICPHLLQYQPKQRSFLTFYPCYVAVYTFSLMKKRKSVLLILVLLHCNFDNCRILKITIQESSF